MLDYPSLAAVAAVVREGSFERAARALNVTPSAISQRVKQLEERLGSVLIIRGQPCVPQPIPAACSAATWSRWACSSRSCVEHFRSWRRPEGDTRSSHAARGSERG